MIYLLDPSIQIDRIYSMSLSDEDITERIKQGAVWYCTDCKKQFTTKKEEHQCQV